MPISCRQWKKLRAFAFAKTGDIAEADDVAQQAVQILVQRIEEREEHIEKPISFLMTTVVNLLSSSWRTQRSQLGKLQENASLLAARVSESPSPVDAAIQNEQFERLHEALSRLGTADQEILCLRYFEQLENRLVAEGLGISDSAATMRVVRAIGRLREAFASLASD